MVGKEVDVEDGTKCTVVIALNNKRLRVLFLQIFVFISLPPMIA